MPLQAWRPMGPPPLCAAHSGLWRPSSRATTRCRPPSALGHLPEPSAAAAAPDELGCVHFESCSGCTLRAGLASPPVLAEAAAFFQQQGLGLQLDCGSARGWRRRARLAVQPAPGGRLVIGLFRQGSHEAVAIPRCVAHHPAINRAVAVVQQCAEELSVRGYDEATGTGQLRYIQLTVVGDAGSSSSAGGTADPSGPSAPEQPSVQIVLVWNSASEAGAVPRQLQRLADSIWRAAGSGGDDGSMADVARPARSWQQQRRQQRHKAHARQERPGRDAGLVHSVWANFQPARTNTILGPGWMLLHGPELAWARLGGADVCFAPGSFLQVNFDAMDRCLQAMQRWVPAGSTIVDLHAGVGTIGLSLAATRQPRCVRFVEINPLAEAPFRHSAARLAAALGSGSGSSSNGGSSSSGEGSSGGSIPNPTSLEYHVAAAGSDPGRWLAGAEVAVVDPPRKGLEEELLRFLCSPEALTQHPGLHRVLYLSCGWPAFVRDASGLLGSGRWRLAHAEAFAFFPATNHIETLAVFDRRAV